MIRVYVHQSDQANEMVCLREDGVTARAVLLSNTGDTLYVGEDSRTIRDDHFGTIDLHVEKRNPVLVVCLGIVRLTRDQNYVGRFVITNKGTHPTGTVADTLRWRTDETSVCSEADCVTLEDTSGVVTTLDSVEISVFGEVAAPGAELALNIRSRSGRAHVVIQFAEGP